MKSRRGGEGHVLSQFDSVVAGNMAHCSYLAWAGESKFIILIFEIHPLDLEFIYGE